jgi:predicted transglutaminase-like cysteine proteinase
MGRSFREMIAVAAALAATPILAGTAAAMPLGPYAFTPVSPDVFGTVALNAGMTAYDVRWRRVSAADHADPRIAAIAAAASGFDPLRTLAAIQTEVNRRVKWRADLDGYGVSDYWANAGETLTKGIGDSEDIAVVKMQALKAAGFSPRDLYLSIGRDKLRGADTLLLVRAAGKFYVLDDRAVRPMIAEQYARFVPVITLGQGRTWLHGRNIAGGAGTVRTAR